MDLSNRFGRHLYQASQSARQAVMEAEHAQEIMHQALDIGHPGDIEYARGKLQAALNQVTQAQNVAGHYINVDEQQLLQQAEFALRNEYQHLEENDITDLKDQLQYED